MDNVFANDFIKWYFIGRSFQPYGLKMKATNLLWCILFFAAGCAFQLHTTEKNALLYKDPTEFQERVNTIKPDISEETFFETMGIEPGKTAELERLDINDLTRWVRGCEQPITPAGFAEKVSEDCAQYHGWMLPYALISPTAKIGLTLPEIFKLMVTTSGHDLKLVAVFRDKKLWKPFVSGRAVIGSVETYYIWDVFGDIVSGGASQGAKEAIKAF